VLLHGFLGSRDSWRHVLELEPADVVEVFCPDLPGHHGEKPAASFEAALEGLATQIRRRFGGLPVLIAGYSLGARLALGLLTSFSELFRGGLLIGLRAGLDGVEREERALADAKLARTLRAEGLGAFLERWRGLPLFASQLGLPAEVLAEQDAINRGHDKEALATTLEALSPGRMADYRLELPRLALPIDLLVGETDTNFLALAQEMQRQLPNARLGVVPGVGHNVLLEAPAAVSAALGRLEERTLHERQQGR